MIRTSTTKTYAFLATLIVSGTMQARDYRTDYNTMQYEAGDLAFKVAIANGLKGATGKKAVIEKKVGGIPVLTHEEISRATVDGARELARTQNGSQAAEAAAVSLVAAKVVSYGEVAARYARGYLGQAANYCGVTYFDNFVESHPELSENARLVTTAAAHIAVKSVVQGQINKACCKCNTN